MIIKRKIRFVLEKRKRKGSVITSNVPIRIRVSFNGKRLDFFSGFRIDTENWDTENHRVFQNKKNKAGQSANEINLTLNNYENDLDRFFIKCAAMEVDPSADAIKEEIESIKAKNRFAKESATEIEPTNNFYDVF